MIKTPLATVPKESPPAPPERRPRSDSKTYWICDICHHTIQETEIIYTRDEACLDGGCRHEEKTLQYFK